MSDLMSKDQADALRSALKNSLYPGASDASIDNVLAYCKAARVDPMTKPVHIVATNVKIGVGKFEWRDVIFPGIELYRSKAHLTGEYVGQDEPEFGPETEGVFGGVTVIYPKWVKITVYRQKGSVKSAYTAKIFWLEACATFDDGTPNLMWQKRPNGQAEKCAEAMALRKAFPEAVGANPTAEEMEGRILDLTDGAKTPGVQQPQSKSAAAKAAEGEPVVVEDAAPPAEVAKEAPKDEQKPALNEGMLKILNARLLSANLTMDQLMAGMRSGKHGELSAANINHAFEWIKSQGAVTP